MLLRSPEFVVPASACTLSVTALQSPNVHGSGTTQSKLLGAFALSVNGIAVTAGPGHNVPTSQQAVVSRDVSLLLRGPPATNVLAFECFYQPCWSGACVPAADVPRVQAELVCGENPQSIMSTSPNWQSFAADGYFRPSGDAVSAAHWYHVFNENLDARERQLWWERPGFVPLASQGWQPAVVQPAFAAPLYAEPAPVPAIMWRSACSVMRLDGTRQVLDYGQQLQGGVNLSFVAVAGAFPAGTEVTIKLGEELLSDGSVRVPSRAAENYTSRWTLDASGSANNIGLHAHELIQFRFAEVSGSPIDLTPESARAWVILHPLQGGSGVNPFEIACAKSQPLSPPPGPPLSSIGTFASSSAALDSVFNLTAYTALATSLDINVDSQTRQRDLCHIDALITGLLQYCVFPTAGGYALQRRTFLNAFTNSSNIWTSSFEFKASTALMAHLDALETGSLEVADAVWSDDDLSVDASGDFMSAQFMSGVRYFNLSGTDLLHFPPNCGGPWGCQLLADWPTTTQDGYVVATSNTDDSIRNGIGAAAIRGMSALAGWRNDSVASARYSVMSSAIRAAFAKLLVVNGSEAYYRDGLNETHSAIHSTIYAVAGADAGLGDETLACQLAAYLRRRDTGAASCMTARWHVEALFKLGVWCGAAADGALDLLSRERYPSWRFMITNASATTTLEAWQPEDKSNCDYAHPWCASPAYHIPRLLMGIAPAPQSAPGWTRVRAAPQPGDLTTARVTVPTPRGDILASFVQGPGVVELRLTAAVPSIVCLPPLHAAFGGGKAVAPDTLTVDGVAVASAAEGRLLCTLYDVGAGSHVMQRVVAS